MTTVCTLSSASGRFRALPIMSKLDGIGHHLRYIGEAAFKGRQGPMQFVRIVGKAHQITTGLYGACCHPGG